LTGTDLGGLTLTPGVYFFSSSAELTGTLTLDAKGDPNARFDFLIGTTLTTASSSSLLLIGSAQACHIFWQVGSSATLGTGTSFDGSILADQSITLTTGASLIGRALALNGAVTLDDNLITVPTCASVAVPEPATFWASGLCASLFGWQWLAVWRRKAGRS
jgi:type VI secretion system secreted protein VgrG